MSGKVSDLPIRFKRAVFRSGNGGRVLRNPPGVTARCWSRAWSHDSLSHGIRCHGCDMYACAAAHI